MSDIVTMKIKTDTNVHSISSFVVLSFREGKIIELQSIGAGATNQLVKGLAEAQRILKLDDKIDICFKVEFIKIKFTDKVVSGIKFSIVREKTDEVQ